MWNRRGIERVDATTGVLLLCATNVRATWRFFPDGRGHFREALHDIQVASPGARTTLGAEYEFRIQLALAYHGGSLPPGPAIQFVPQNWWTLQPPEWLVFDSTTSMNPEENATIQLKKDGGLYNRVKIYRSSSEIAGMPWYVYRRVDK